MAHRRNSIYDLNLYFPRLHSEDATSGRYFVIISQARDTITSNDITFYNTNFEYNT